MGRQAVFCNQHFSGFITASHKMNALAEITMTTSINLDLFQTRFPKPH